ncbi:MAG: sigma 54-interacting transcriptional regulator [Planctomycetes bacterium]|nr:sigma 54-interacting transcriptional regulator [Planctomycetota bacterium]
MRIHHGVAPPDGSEAVEVGDIPIRIWPDLLNAPYQIREHLSKFPEKAFDWAQWDAASKQRLIRVRFQDPAGEFEECWCYLGALPPEELVPSILWFILKFMLFSVGALVLWKRPTDKAAAQFFLLCIVTLGAYMGGYHWSHITRLPILLLVFMVCSVLLPVVTLHFYLIFPRRKPIVERHPRLTFAAIYGIPLAFLLVMIGVYLRVRELVYAPAPPVETLASLDLLRNVIVTYLGVAGIWYLGSIVALVYSLWTVSNPTEHNQVKWILFGAVLALVPLSFSFYLVLWDPNAFGAGAATWPMFAASACITVAFAISITRYRLMELDKILTSGMTYFLISFLAGLAYYAILFVGTLMFNATPKLSEALAVSTTALLLMLVLDLARTRLKKVLDRRFSRQKSQLDQTLQRLGQAIEQLVDPIALAQKFLQATSDLLGVARGAVYLRQGEPPLYVLATSLGQPPELAELAEGCPLIEATQNGKIVLARGRSVPWSPAQRQLEYLRGGIAQPLAQNGRLLALLILGPKEPPYRQEDLDLLAAFAQITVLALESAAGHRTIEDLNKDIQGKVEKISEQQRRIFALQSQLRRQSEPFTPKSDFSADGKAADGKAVDGKPVDGKAGDAYEMVGRAVTVSSGGIVGSGPAVQHLLNLVRKVAATDAVVFIRGESGTGKELLARAVHETSPRAAKPFVKVHCAALSASLLESELFGHVKGAFTGAHRDKIGRFELANGGTLFLDEIGDISLEVQTKLLRVLQEKTIERVGSSESLAVDVRILAATHQDIEELIREGRFREDLFYRLNVFPIRVPPLRERIEDIPELALHFVREAAERCKKQVTRIEDDVLPLLKGHPWPGNIRQLENVIERAVVITEGDAITEHELPEEFFDLNGEGRPGASVPRINEAVFEFAEGAARVKSPVTSWRMQRERLEREQLVRALAAASGNKAEAARALGVARSTLVSRLKKLGLG